jgi:transposase InsO family protein
MQASLEKRLVIDALQMALHLRGPGKVLLHHSNRGRQYCRYAYQNLLRQNNIICSMSRKGNGPQIRLGLRSVMIMQLWKACRPDVEPSSGLLATLKQELIYQQQYENRAQAK